MANSLESTDISSSNYATRRKELLALINQLRAVGAQNDLDLPRITVIGNQSAGKSSVVEAISGITVPRDAGTCTRCPMECRLLSSSSPWSCQISIRMEFDDTGGRLREVSEVPFGGTIFDKSQVEVILRKAQIAVLNPQLPLAKVLSSSVEELNAITKDKSLLFSKNVVCVDLEGPELTDLSFIDLPGLIQNADDDIVQMVEEMAVSHIRGNCIILVAVPMTDDIENQKALRLAKEEDPTGRRTIGVCTKPDILTSGSTKVVASWLDVIEGRNDRHKLMHGYYCTRQPDDDERADGIEPKEARKKEEAFFKFTPPWSVSSHRARFGTENLVKTLSRLLVQRIDEALPKIREETTKQLSHYRHELSKLAPPITDEPATFLLSLITAFCSDFQTLVQGRADSAELLRAHRKSYGGFRQAIRQTAPSFVPFTSNQEVKDFRNCLDDEKDDPVANAFTSRTSMDLTEVRKHIDQSMTRELPHNVPYEAKTSLIVQFQAKWPAAVDACFRGVEDSTLQILLSMIQSHFGRFSKLEMHVSAFVRMLIDKHKQTCTAALKDILEAERMPYTQNDHYLQSATQGWLDRLKAVRSGNVPEEEFFMRPKQSTATTSSSATKLNPSASAFSLSATANPAESQSKQPGSSATPPKPAVSGFFGASNEFSTSKTASLPYSFGASSSKSATSTTSSSTGFSTPKAASSPFGISLDGLSSKSSTTSSFPGSTAAVKIGSTSATATPGTPKPTDSARSAFAPNSPFAEVIPPPPAPSGFGDAQPASKSAFFSSSAPLASQSNSVQPESKAKVTGAIDEKALQDAIALLVKAGIPVSTLNPKDLLGKLTVADEYETELKVMAEVRGYFQVAYKRLIDHIPQSIDLMFVRAVGKNLQSFIITKFELGTSSANERCASYLGEDPEIVTRREELLARQKRLESVDKELDQFSLRLTGA